MTPAGDPVGAGSEVERALSRQGVALDLSVTPGFDDNVRRVETGGDGRFFLNAKPRARFRRRLAEHRLEIGYDGNYSAFEDAGSEDYDDHRLFADGTLRLHRKFAVRSGGSLSFGHDLRGSTESRLLQVGELDRWRETRAFGEATLGRRIARAEIRLRAEHAALRYSNNNQQLRDVDRLIVKNVNYFKLAPKLSLVLEPSLEYVDYLSPAVTIDSREVAGLVGLRWAATAKTSGEAKIGIEHKDFEAAALDDTVELRWEADVLWEPRSYSKVRLRTGQRSAESTQPGATVQSSHYELQWAHGFTPRLRTDLGARVDFDDFSDGRGDRTSLVWVDARYRLRRWLSIGGALERTSRSSSIPGADYRDHRIMFTVRGHLNGPVETAAVRGY